MPLPIVESKPRSKVRFTLGIAAGKGGVGKSTVAVNLALALKELGLKVGILDADLYGPSLRRMLPEQIGPRQEGDMLIPAQAFGISLISMAYFRSEGQANAVRAPVANGLLTQFIENVYWGELDYLIIDFPPGTGDIQLTLSQKAHIDAAIVVTTPQEIALMDVRKAIELFQKTQIPILGVVENMSYFKLSPEAEPIYLFGKHGGDRLAKEFSLPLLTEIPVDPAVSLRSDKGFSIFVEDGEPPLPSATAFRRLAETVQLSMRSLQKTHLAIEEFAQVDAHRFSIKWSTGKLHTFLLGDIQKRCPCAACYTHRPIVDENVSALKVTPAGRYAVRIAFTSGCSAGLYGLDMLYHLGEKKL